MVPSRKRGSLLKNDSAADSRGVSDSILHLVGHAIASIRGVSPRQRRQSDALPTFSTGWRAPTATLRSRAYALDPYWWYVGRDLPRISDEGTGSTGPFHGPSNQVSLQGGSLRQLAQPAALGAEKAHCPLGIRRTPRSVGIRDDPAGVPPHDPPRAALPHPDVGQVQLDAPLRAVEGRAQQVARPH